MAALIRGKLQSGTRWHGEFRPRSAAVTANSAQGFGYIESGRKKASKGYRRFAGKRRF
jgi:hypothetical protein